MAREGLGLLAVVCLTSASTRRARVLGYPEAVYRAAPAQHLRTTLTGEGGLAAGVVDQSLLRSTALLFGAAGVASGVLAKLIDGWDIAVATDLVGNLGLWILVVSLIGATSRTRMTATIRVTVFLLAMLLGYFGTSALFFHYMPWRYALGWIAVTLVLGIPFAVMTWYSRQTGWLAVCAAAVPVGMLLFSWLPSLLPPISMSPASLVNYVTVFDLVAGVVLAAVLPQGRRQRVRALVIAPAAAVVVALALQNVSL